MTGPAASHPGPVVHVWDHYVIALRDGALERQLSLYSITYSPELGSGHVCVLDPGDGPVRLLSDGPDVGRRMARRLRGMGGTAPGLPDEATPATFSRSPLEATEGFRWSIRSDTAWVEAAWLETSGAFWVQGPAPAFRADEDIWACFVEAGAAGIDLDGRSLSGTTFQQDAWRPKLGRALSSAHVALAEVRVTPQEGTA